MSTDPTSPDPVSAEPGAVPDLGGFETYYGVRMSTWGEDGAMVALGHVDRRRFIAAHLRYAREICGYRMRWERNAERVAKGIEHTWMRNRVPSTDEWILQVATQGHPHAFPVTFWRA